LTEKIEQYRQYVVGAVANYELLRTEHMYATQAIDRDMSTIRDEDRRWERVVEAADTIAGTEPPPPTPTRDRQTLRGIPAARGGSVSELGM